MARTNWVVPRFGRDLQGMVSKLTRDQRLGPHVFPRLGAFGDALHPPFEGALFPVGVLSRKGRRFNPFGDVDLARLRPQPSLPGGQPRGRQSVSRRGIGDGVEFGVFSPDHPGRVSNPAGKRVSPRPHRSHAAFHPLQPGPGQELLAPAGCSTSAATARALFAPDTTIASRASNSRACSRRRSPCRAANSSARAWAPRADFGPCQPTRPRSGRGRTLGSAA